MFDFGQILFPVDFSENARQAASYVSWIAAKYHSKVTIVHVLEPNVSSPIAPESYQQLICQHREDALKDFALEEFSALSTLRIMQQGDPAHSIVHYANTHNIGLILLPNRGLGDFRSLLLGSVTSKVLHESACPVWTTAHASHLEKKIEHIVCGVDLYSDFALIIQAASEMAAYLGASVQIVHAVAAPEVRTGSSLDDHLKQFLLDKATEAIVKAQQQAGTDCPSPSKGGSVPDVLRQAAEHVHADLVVIGRGHVQASFGRFRTHLANIIQQSPCPVLSV